MSSSVGEHCETTSLNTTSSQPFESAMLQPVANKSSDSDEVVSSRDDTTVKAELKVSRVDDSQQTVDKLGIDEQRNDSLPIETTRSSSVTNDIELKKEDDISTTTDINHEPTTITTNEGTSSNTEVAITFPQRLMEMLDDPQNAEMMAWLPHGRAFAIYRKREFASDVLPKYFQKAAKYSSFTRKLNRWGFVRITRGPETGAYYHRLFRRNERRLVLQMTCHTTTTSNSGSASTSTGSSTSKRVSGSSHASAENDSLAMMMMYPNHLDPASQYMYHNYPYGAPQQQHQSMYSHMGQQQSQQQLQLQQQQHQNYYGIMPPYNMYDPSSMDVIMPPSLSDDGQYYPPAAIGGVYPNPYGIPQQPHGSFGDPYAQQASSFHDRNNMDVPPYGDAMTSQSFHNENIGRSHLLPVISERTAPSSSTTTSDVGGREEQYNYDDDSKANYRPINKGMSSFRPTGRHDSEYHAIPTMYNNDDMTMYGNSSTNALSYQPEQQHSSTYGMNNNIGSEVDSRVMPPGFADESMRHSKQHELEMQRGMGSNHTSTSNTTNSDNPMLFSPAGRPSSSSPSSYT